jgi:hypothetical protein
VDTEQHLLVIDLLAVIRKQATRHLPIGHSFIPYDILVVVVGDALNNNELTVKALFASLPYSDMGLRYHFRKLIEAGWIELHSTTSDARVKKVKPTEKLSIQFALFSNAITTQLQTPQISPTST